MVQVANTSTTCDRFIKDRTAIHFLNILAEVTDRQPLRNRNLAFVGSFLPITMRKSLSSRRR